MIDKSAEGIINPAVIPAKTLRFFRLFKTAKKNPQVRQMSDAAALFISRRAEMDHTNNTLEIVNARPEKTTQKKLIH